MSRSTEVTRTAVITGAARGIGRAYAQRLAADGHNVVVADILPGEETVKLIDDAGGTAISLHCDISSEDSVSALRAEVTQRYGDADILVNNAVAYARGLLEELTLDDWRRVQSVAVDGMFLMSRAFVPGMRAKGWGRVINITSGTIAMMAPGLLPYITAKGGVIGFTRALASDLGRDGITVNAVAPGLTRTDQTAQFMTPAFFAEIASRQAIQRTEIPEDLVGTISFLASDDSAFITGQTIAVDGGLIRL